MSGVLPVCARQTKKNCTTAQTMRPTKVMTKASKLDDRDQVRTESNSRERKFFVVGAV